MTTTEAMQLGVERALEEISWDSIEWLFKPTNQFELFLRFDLEGMENKVEEWSSDCSPEAMPHRFRGPYLSIMRAAIEKEKFYRRIKWLMKEKQVTWRLMGISKCCEYCRHWKQSPYDCVMGICLHFSKGLAGSITSHGEWCGYFDPSKE